MATSIFGNGSVEYASDLYDEVLRHKSNSEQDNLGLTLQSPARNTDSSSSSPPPDLPSWDKIPTSNLPGRTRASLNYELRPGPRADGKLLSSTWLDQDGTATYDPNIKLDPYVQPPTEILEKRRRRRVHHSEDDPNRPKIHQKSTWQRGRIEGKRLPLTFSFATQRGKAVLISYGAALDSWPSTAWRPPNKEISWDFWWNSCLFLDGDESSEPSSGQHKRRRGPAQDSDEDAEPTNIADLSGHPAARGCKGCFNVGHRCPLLDEGSRYPCEICTQDGVDCELIREPTKKRACLNCGHKRICCSYREEGSDHSQRCLYCANQGLKCIAGPASGRTRTGPALDFALPDRGGAVAQKFASCMQCRKAKTWCSRIKNKTAARCNECIKNKDTCTFESIQRAKTRAKCVSKLLTRPKTFSATTIQPTTTRNITQFIKTKLPHPIELNFIGDAPCQWCQDVGYGILGLGEALAVEVMDFNDGNGYIELDGGYSGAGYGPSRMCDKCTFERLAIAACLGHNIQDLKRIDGMHIDNFDFDCVFDYLLPGMAASAPFSWCSICPNPAFHACCKQLDMGITGMEGTEGAEQWHGCGLKLCEDCAMSLINESGGDLEALVEGIKDRGEGVIGLRADVDLILPRGELVRRIGRQ